MKTAHSLEGINSVILLDTNVFIYLASIRLPRELIADVAIAHPSVVKIEALGFSSIPANELLLLTELFAESYNYALTEPIVDRAIRLRQARQMKLGDAIIAATALEHNLPLWTANTADFQHIEGLKLVNPLTLK